MTSRPGFAAERTTLSWNRTALGAGAFGVLLLRLGIAENRPLEVVAAVIGLALAGALVRPPVHGAGWGRLVLVAALAAGTAALTTVSLLV